MINKTNDIPEKSYVNAKVSDDILLSSYINGQHLAIATPFKALYASLMDEVAKGTVNRVLNENSDLELFSYSIQCQFERSWNKYNLLARGLVLCPKKEKVVALTYPKFFNYGECSPYIPNEPFLTTGKMDGSLGIIYFWNNEWQVNTRGSFHSEQAIWAKNWLNNNINKMILKPGTTYLVEIIYKENKIVIPYDYEGLVYLTLYSENGYEPKDYDGLSRVFMKSAGFLLPEVHFYKTIEEMIEVAGKLPYTEEGFVVRFESGYRIKIKSDDYVRIHKLISNVKPLFIWECMMQGDDLKKIRTELPEEMLSDFDQIYDILKNKFYDIVEEVNETYEKLSHLSDKNLGLWIKENPGRINNLLFLVRKKNLLVDAFRGGSKMRKRIFEMFRPNGNVLKEYTPSTIVNRF
jgi:RNA ligase